ncbi:hypothetical protein VF21_08641 [Pseudogymnoascus sp. 05NY08]|nr:hypothetical protein VF21_08641 [Pseudogymnoascus sp. 05NY08]
MKERPGFNIGADITFGLEEFEQIITLKLLALIEPRIDEIEQLARNQHLEIPRRGLYSQKLENPFFNGNEKIELLTRITVRSKFIEALSGKLEQSLLKDLKRVFFEILYPTPTLDMK